MQSLGMNIAAMFIEVCIDMCASIYVCVWPGPNGKTTTAHQLLFDYGSRGSGTKSVIRQR